MTYNSWDALLGAVGDNTRATNYAADQASRDANETQRHLRDIESVIGTTNSKLGILNDGVRAGFQETVKALKGMDQAVQTGFKSLANKMERQIAATESVDQALRNPKAIAAAEHFRIAIQMWKNNLLPEAEEEFRASLEEDKMQALTYYGLALTLMGMGNREEALKTLRAGHRYCTIEREVSVYKFSPVEVRSSYALGFNELAETNEEKQFAYQEINNVLDHFIVVGAVLLAKIVFEFENDYAPEVIHDTLVRLLSCSPEYALFVKKLGVPRVDEVVEELYNDNYSRVRCAVNFYRAARSVSALQNKVTANLPEEMLNDPVYATAGYLTIAEAIKTISWSDCDFAASNLNATPQPNGEIELVNRKIASFETQLNDFLVNDRAPKKPGLMAGRTEKDNYAKMVQNKENYVNSMNEQIAAMRAKVVELEQQDQVRFARHREEQKLVNEIDASKLNKALPDSRGPIKF